jgi:hypothetical protein
MDGGGWEDRDRVQEEFDLYKKHMADLYRQVDAERNDLRSELNRVKFDLAEYLRTRDGEAYARLQDWVESK